jgi:hypothetical protein
MFMFKCKPNFYYLLQCLMSRTSQCFKKVFCFRDYLKTLSLPLWKIANNKNCKMTNVRYEYHKSLPTVPTIDLRNIYNDPVFIQKYLIWLAPSSLCQIVDTPVSWFHSRNKKSNSKEKANSRFYTRIWQKRIFLWEVGLG